MYIEVYPPSGLNARQQGQRHRRQREGLPRSNSNGATDGATGLQTPPPDLSRHDLGPPSGLTARQLGHRRRRQRERLQRSRYGATDGPTGL